MGTAVLALLWVLCQTVLVYIFFALFFALMLNTQHLERPFASSREVFL